jgi:hypothetical protein
MYWIEVKERQPRHAYLPVITTLGPFPTALKAQEEGDRLRRAAAFDDPKFTIKRDRQGTGLHVARYRRKSEQGGPRPSASHNR